MKFNEDSSSLYSLSNFSFKAQETTQNTQNSKIHFSNWAGPLINAKKIIEKAATIEKTR